MKQFSLGTRAENISRMKTEDFDLVIIGGGINGAGVARDAVTRGLKVALVEAHDFASGTSSKSSKLIHGGIRYLENLEFKLVFEALNERTRLFEMAPHLVHPLRFMIPLYKESRVGMFKMGLGMWLYDALSLFQAPELHERLNSESSLQRMPAMRAQNLVGSYVYSDAYMDDDRLVHETLRSANEMGALCVNYVKAVGAQFSDNHIASVVCEDSLSQERFNIKAKHVVSCVGPWTDEVGHLFTKDWQNKLRPTKGIHLTLPKNRLPLESAVVMAAEKSDRIVFGIPRHEMIIIGTTDTDFKGDLDQVTATPEDVQYLLEITKQYFPGANLTANDVISSYAGVRPLVKDEAATEGKTSREHTIISDPRGLTFIVGGKYTTYRLMCEQTVDRALSQFSIEDRARLKRSDTCQPLNEYTSVEAFHQALAKVNLWSQQFQRPEAQVRLLCERYGQEALEILQSCPKDYSYWQMEASQAIEHTMCLHLVDFYARRVPLFLADHRHGVELLEEVGPVFQEKLGWSEAKLKEEQDQLLQFIARELEWKRHF